MKEIGPSIMRCPVRSSVMPFGMQPWLALTTFEEQWRMALEDARDHEPDALWFMGSDARLNGAVGLCR